MPDVLIENPILNSPFGEPTRHFKFTEDGITNQIVEKRRSSGYFVPIHQPKKKGKQLVFDSEWTQDRFRESEFINRVRDRANVWRQQGWPGVTNTTARLLRHWTDPDREHRLFFCQIEALETAIYLAEVAEKSGDAWLPNSPREANEIAKEISPKNLKPQEGFVAEWEEEYGRLPVLLVRMNPDLSMGDELLKKTGAGNLFMVFGEPDMTIANQDGKIVVEIRGVDVYDPTTGVIRSSSTDDIACWFLDTNYDEESFFVRHAYFTGAGDPYERLKRSLRAEIDDAAWASLYSTVSRPFDPPSTGKIAIKVINHYGDEVLKVFTDFPSKAALGGI